MSCPDDKQGSLLEAGSKQQGPKEAHLLSTLSHRLQVVLGQAAIDDKSNEITAIDTLLALVSVVGRIPTTETDAASS